MNEVIRNMAGQTDPSPMWVASIENGQNGACVIQYPHFLDDAAETLGGSFYVLPPLSTRFCFLPMTPVRHSAS